MNFLKVYIRYLYSGSVYGFRSDLLGYTQKPVRLLFLTYPQKIEQVNLRRSMRKICYIPTSAYIHQSKWKGVIVDISSTDCKFISETPPNLSAGAIAVGDTLQLDFPLLGLDGTSKFSGIVRNLHQDGKWLSLGIEFLNINPELNSQIDTYVNTALQYQ
ncbi:MAG: PilZ domain-containing protein [Desulfatirhabdiaceae bacterium]